MVCSFIMQRLMAHNPQFRMHGLIYYYYIVCAEIRGREREKRSLRGRMQKTPLSLFCTIVAHKSIHGIVKFIYIGLPFLHSLQNTFTNKIGLFNYEIDKLNVSLQRLVRNEKLLIIRANYISAERKHSKVVNLNTNSIWFLFCQCLRSALIHAVIISPSSL